MPKKTKTEEISKKESAKAADQPQPRQSWWRNRWFLIGAVVMMLLLVAGAVYFYLNRSGPAAEDDATPAQQTPSLADALENAELDDSLDEEQKGLHYLSVAAAYMSEENYEKALEQYLNAEEAGAVSSRLYTDVADIYKGQGDQEKHRQYLRKLIEYLENEISSAERPLTRIGSYVALARVFEKLEELESAKAAFESALQQIAQIDSSDMAGDESLTETKRYIEDRLSQL